MDPAPLILQALEESEDAIEALLILNSLVMLQDGQAAIEFDLSQLKLDSSLDGDRMLQWRMDYLVPGTTEP